MAPKELLLISSTGIVKDDCRPTEFFVNHSLEDH